jgi:uncharacterized protein YuzE
MEAVKLLEKASPLSWDYDEDADVLYLAIGQPGPAEGIDIGDGVVMRYDPKRREVVGLTLIGLRAKLVERLQKSA